MPSFDYLPRITCICGDTLLDDAPVICRHVGWGQVRFIQCQACGSWCQSPLVTAQSTTAWYDSNEYRGGVEKLGSVYVDYLKDEPCRLREGRVRYERDFVNYLPKTKAKILEIGCATGGLLAAIREFGHEVSGLDLSPRFADEAKQLYGLDVQVGDLAKVDFPPQNFDMIILLGTISNLRDIPSALSKIRSLLKRNGTLVFNFPAADSITARLYGHRYWMFTPSVGTFMSTSCCRKILSLTGFQDTSIKTDCQMPSLSKVFNHAKLPLLLPVAKVLSGRFSSFPFPMPIPGVKLVRSRNTSAQYNAQ